MRKYLIIIPARLKSKRLPSKPLLEIKGIPMVVRTFRQCKKAIPEKNIIVATDSNKILSICKQFRVPTIMTSKKHLTGTDRIVEVSKKINSEIYINLQGDEPIFPSKDIKKFVKIALKNKKEILNGYCKINKLRDYKNLNIPKLVFDENNYLLYMSRSTIPASKKFQFKEAYKQVCIYSFPKDKLRKFQNKKKTKFEKIEDIEILRFLELGHKVKMIRLSSKSISVDTKKDLARVRRLVLK
tara:strand:- start:993 stop:1715 length:723 start_codon:yes stop_codon:yes gene_type:complete